MQMDGLMSSKTSIPRWLLAELSYRCPLRCVYCSNPENFGDIKDELSTADWVRVLKEARELGAVQLGFSGGEPLVRSDLEELVSTAHHLGFYSNLITSGIGLTDGRIARLKEAGLDHIQLSFQASSAGLNDWIGGAKTFSRKKEVAKRIKSFGFPMVLNVVIHKFNIDELSEIMEFALELNADYLELANVQFDGYAYNNRMSLMPSATQMRNAEVAVMKFRQVNASTSRMKIYFVVSDYLAGRPKPCGGGWAQNMLAVTPDGLVLPCHGARKLPLDFPNVKNMSLREIWEKSPAFNKFRGEGWMEEPCRSCPERSQDFGGCRCQAFLLTGNAASADPTCSLSPHHKIIQKMTSESGQSIPMTYRDKMQIQNSPK